jgi:restriction endonuclease Mrr
MKIERLSALQKSLLEKGLRAALQSDSGCFGLKATRGQDPETGRQLPITDHRKRAAHRAAAGLSVRRLVDRGLVESHSRGKWRLTPRGVKVARKLYPEIKPPTKREVASEIAFRATIHEALGPRRRRQRPGAKTSLPAKESGVEIPWE